MGSLAKQKELQTVMAATVGNFSMQAALLKKVYGKTKTEDEEPTKPLRARSRRKARSNPTKGTARTISRDGLVTVIARGHFHVEVTHDQRDILP